MTYLAKYPVAAAAVPLPTSELRADLRNVQALIEREHGGSQCSVLGVVEGWIGQELRRRTPGLGAPIS